MSLLLSVSPAFLNSDFLPNVCIFTGRIENLKTVQLPKLPGLPQGLTPLRVTAEPSAAIRFWLHDRWLPPLAWLAAILISFAAVFLPLAWIHPPWAFVDSAKEPTVLTWLLIGLTVVLTIRLGTWLTATVRSRNLQVAWAHDLGQVRFIFPDRMTTAHAAWQDALRDFELAGRPPPDKSTRDPEENWADHQAGSWDAAPPP